MMVGTGTSVDAAVGMRCVVMVPVPARLKPIASEAHVNVYNTTSPFYESALAMALRRAVAASRAAVSSRISRSGPLRTPDVHGNDVVARPFSHAPGEAVSCRPRRQWCHGNLAAH
jgi:hypothetical protein